MVSGRVTKEEWCVQKA